jgi:hypothetical protein
VLEVTLAQGEFCFLYLGTVTVLVEMIVDVRVTDAVAAGAVMVGSTLLEPAREDEDSICKTNVVDCGMFSASPSLVCFT